MRQQCRERIRRHRDGANLPTESAEMAIPAEVVRPLGDQASFTLELADGSRIRSSTVVVATGTRYRRPEIPHLADFEGGGVWYWASPIEARMCRAVEIALVGGGNLGQAAAFLRNFASLISILVRGPDLGESMSRYLMERNELRRATI
jgi:thioredoxin reductase (NADPH)